MVAKASELKREGRESEKKGRRKIKLDAGGKKTFFLPRSFPRKTWKLTHEEWILVGKSTFFFSYERYSIRSTMCVCGSWNGNFLFLHEIEDSAFGIGRKGKIVTDHLSLSPHFLFLTSSDLVFRSSWCLTVHETLTLTVTSSSVFFLPPIQRFLYFSPDAVILVLSWDELRRKQRVRWG